MIKIRFSF